MPRVIDTATTDIYELGDLVEELETVGFDPRDEDNFAAFGVALKKLANNRTFLTDLVVKELKERCAGQLLDNQYPSQVILLPVRSSRYMMRANFWPSATDSIMRSSGANPFSYHVPHDHNFSFLTVGYLGPGYWSEYYEYDYEEVIGFTGEEVNLHFVEKSRLDEGKVMLYRAHKDVHNQLLADSMSVSINILEADHTIPFRDQYRFDLQNNTIATILTNGPIDPLLRLSAHFGGEAGTDLLDSYVATHPSERVRLKALQARAGGLDSLDARIALYEKVARGGNRFLAEMARREARSIEAGRSWIDGPTAIAAE